MYQTDPPLPPKECLPTMYDLKSEDIEEPGLPDEFHILQPQLLRETFYPPTYPAGQIFTAADLNLYYDSRHPLWYKRPDWFAVVGVSRLYEEQDLRLSYVVWQEGVNPFVVVELLSPGTEKEDLGDTLRDVNQPPTKWQVYEQILRIPYYIVFDRYIDQLRAFQLVADRYGEISLDTLQVWMPGLELGLGLWYGSYQGIERLWLRWYDTNGNWVSTSQELMEQERARVEETNLQLQQERARVEETNLQLQQERAKAERLAAQLRAMGIEPENP
jgi:Uma2 family endonuclease